MLYFSAPFPLFSCLCCWRFQLLSIHQHSRILPPWHLLPQFSFCIPGFPSMFLPPTLSSVLPASLSFVLLTRCSSGFEEPAFWPQPRIQQLLKLRATCNIQAREGSSEKRPRHKLFSKVHVLAMEQGPALFSVQIGLLPSTNGSLVRLPEWGLKAFPLPPTALCVFVYQESHSMSLYFILHTCLAYWIPAGGGNDLFLPGGTTPDGVCQEPWGSPIQQRQHGLLRHFPNSPRLSIRMDFWALNGSLSDFEDDTGIY